VAVVKKRKNIKEWRKWGDWVGERDWHEKEWKWTEGEREKACTC